MGRPECGIPELFHSGARDDNDANSLSGFRVDVESQQFHSLYYDD
jgi:hypothetical protein